MKKHVFYVGLSSICGMDEKAIFARALAVFRIHFDGFTVERCTGYWLGEQEPAAKFTVFSDTCRPHTICRILCETCNQDAVLFGKDSVGELVYRESTCDGSEYVGHTGHSDLMDQARQLVADSNQSAATENQESHIGHLSQSGIQGHSCGPIYPWLIVDKGRDKMELWDETGSVVCIRYYDWNANHRDETGTSYRECHRDLEDLAKIMIENRKVESAIEDRFGGQFGGAV